MGLHQQNESYQATGRLIVALVLVQLARGDVVAAEKAFKEWGGYIHCIKITYFGINRAFSYEYLTGNYCEAPELQTLETLLTAYDEEDPENAKRALNSPFIKHMDVEYAILARDMPLPESSIPRAAASASNNVPGAKGEEVMHTLQLKISSR